MNSFYPGPTSPEEHGPNGSFPFWRARTTVFLVVPSWLLSFCGAVRRRELCRRLIGNNNAKIWLINTRCLFLSHHHLFPNSDASETLSYPLNALPDESTARLRHCTCSPNISLAPFLQQRRSNVLSDVRRFRRRPHAYFLVGRVRTNDHGDRGAYPISNSHVDSSDPLGARWVIPLVCRRWNAVSRACLAMWQHIYLVLPSEADMLLRRSLCRSKEDSAPRWKTRVDQLLARSSSLELCMNIRMNVTSLDEFGAFRHVFLQCIVSSVNRWKSLCIAGKSSAINALLSSLDFRNLVSLNVLDTEQLTGETITVFQNALTIQSFEVSVARWNKRIPTRHLCHVSVPSAKVEYLSAWSHPSMRIHAMKNLVTLHLFFLSPQTVPRINTHVTLYTVQDMSLAENTFASGAMSAFMKLFHTPELRRLRLAFGRPRRDFDDVEIPTLPYLLRRLESLTIDCFHGIACFMRRDKLHQFLDKTTEVRTLQFDTNVESHIFSALESGYLPRLKKIVLADPQWRIFHRLLNRIVNLRGGKLSLEYRF